ncbi:MAG: glycosyltransferase [Candidatus Margulisbacteria bacterium]|nr:glycosyltransferase [Candidatus Margulisiibacteriota bacterium]
MKIFVIGHNFVLQENHKQLHYLLQQGRDLQLMLLVPPWWDENTRKVFAEKTEDKTYKIIKGKTLFTGNNALYFYINKLFTALFSFQPDLIEIFEEPWSLSVLQLVVLKKILRLKAKIVCYSAQNIYKKLPFPFNLIENFNFRNIQGIHVCSQEVAAILRQKKYNGEVRNLGLGLDTDIFFYKPKLAGKTLELGYAGRLVEAKGVFDLLTAMISLDNAVLTICGSGPAESRLKKYIKNYHLEKKVVLKGPLKLPELINFYHSLDLLVVPSRTTTGWKEQFGRIIIEAFACGTTTLGSKSGSIPEITSDYGLIFEEGNIQDMLNKITEYKKNWETWQNKKPAARQHVLDLFSWPNIAKKYYAFYTEVIKLK